MDLEIGLTTRSQVYRSPNPNRSIIKIRQEQIPKLAPRSSGKASASPPCLPSCHNRLAARHVWIVLLRVWKKKIFLQALFLMAPAKGPPVATCQLWGLITWTKAGSGTFFLGPLPQMLTSSRWAVCYLHTLKTSLWDSWGPAEEGYLGVGEHLDCHKTAKLKQGGIHLGRSQVVLWSGLGTSPRDRRQPSCWKTAELALSIIKSGGGADQPDSSCPKACIWKASLKRFDRPNWWFCNCISLGRPKDLSFNSPCQGHPLPTILNPPPSLWPAESRRGNAFLSLTNTAGLDKYCLLLFLGVKAWETWNGDVTSFYFYFSKCEHWASKHLKSSILTVNINSEH